VPWAFAERCAAQYKLQTRSQAHRLQIQHFATYVHTMVGLHGEPRLQLTWQAASCTASHETGTQAATARAPAQPLLLPAAGPEARSAPGVLVRLQHPGRVLGAARAALPRVAARRQQARAQQPPCAARAALSGAALPAPRSPAARPRGCPVRG